MQFTLNDIAIWITIATVVIAFYRFVAISITKIQVNTLKKSKPFKEMLDSHIDSYLERNKVKPEYIQSSVDKIIGNRLNKGEFSLGDSFMDPYLAKFDKQEDIFAKTVFYLNYKQLVSDSHLSRMNSWFLLKDKEYLWAIGWAIRSMKRLGTIKPQQIEIEGTFKYSDMASELFDIVVQALMEIVKLIESGNISAVNVMFHDEEKMSRTAVRAFKDISDFFDQPMCVDLLGTKHKIARELLYNVLKLFYVAEVMNQSDLEELKLYIGEISWFKEKERAFVNTLVQAKDSANRIAEDKSQSELIDKYLASIREITHKYQKSNF